MTFQSVNSINDAFPYKVCINLDRRPEAWDRMQGRFARHDIGEVRRLSATDGSRLILPATWRYSAGEYGCLQSHRRAVTEARRLCFPSLLVFEDDVEFDPFFRDKFPEFVRGVPADWDMIYFGALHREDPVPVSQTVCRISQAYSTYAYALKNTVFDAFIESNQRTEAPVDLNNFALHSQYKCYCFMPHLAWVETRYSDVQERMADHWYLRESIVIFGEEMDRILGRTLVVIAYNNSGKTEACERNLIFLTQFYGKLLKRIRTLVVEQNCEGTIDAAALPADCRNLILKDGGPFDLKRCFAAGLNHAEADCDYVILSDSNTFVDALNIRANLRMCERFDCATGFKSVVHLSETDTEQVRLNNFSKGIDLTGCARSGEQRPFVSYGIFRRHVLENQARLLNDIALAPDGEGIANGDRQVRVFESPNDALRLNVHR
jgi:GR25 family glycosyltransferase involved in LPS biosynthesis